MTAGASGGGWVIRRDDRGYVASVTSYGYANDADRTSTALTRGTSLAALSSRRRDG